MTETPKLTSREQAQELAKTLDDAALQAVTNLLWEQLKTACGASNEMRSVWQAFFVEDCARKKAAKGAPK